MPSKTYGNAPYMSENFFWYVLLISKANSWFDTGRKLTITPVMKSPMWLTMSEYS